MPAGPSTVERGRIFLFSSSSSHVSPAAPGILFEALPMNDKSERPILEAPTQREISSLTFKSHTKSFIEIFSTFTSSSV